MKPARAFIYVILLTFGLFVKLPCIRGQQIQPANDLQAVRRVENRFHQAFVASDINTFNTLLTADFVWMHGDGAVWTKQRLIDEFRSGKLRYRRDDIDRVKVTIYGPTAVVIGHDARQYAKGEPFEFNYTTTYVKQNGEWLVAVFHSSHCPCARQQPTK